MYYLKNIANESVVLTVDREIEFSGQIITSIQENIDRIHHDKVDVDFVTKSARKLGGDFIDFIKLGEDKYLFVMGDVSGKGLNASMSMVILKSVLRTFLSETGDFKKLVVKVNLFIKNQLPKGTFFAGMFGLMDFSTNTLFYINCGVPAMFLYTAAYNNAIEIQGDGKVLGFVRDIGKFLKVKKIVLNPQDIILLTTDGLVDSTNLRGERFGKDRVQRMLMDNRSYPADRMAKFLCDSLEDFVSRELEDDISVLVFKYLSR
jgi:serine phosphatase RsbU (regulator of sigma subunit)